MLTSEQFKEMNEACKIAEQSMKAKGIPFMIITPFNYITNFDYDGHGVLLSRAKALIEYLETEYNKYTTEGFKQVMPKPPQDVNPITG